jgi:muramoyltetrapeptide carboxypeptidase
MSAPPSVVRKPKALHKGSMLAYFAPASPPNDFGDVQMGVIELQRFGFETVSAQEFMPSGYFAGSTEERLEGFRGAMHNTHIDGLVAVRGGYGSTYLLDSLAQDTLDEPKCLIGYSDITVLQTYLWQKHGWVTFHGPMLAMGFDHGANDLRGFKEDSFLKAVTSTEPWSQELCGETLVAGEGEGRLLGGCLTMLQTTLGTPWEIDTSDAMLVLEDTYIKPYQVDRALMHLKQAGKLDKLRGIILGEFPGSEPPVANSPTVRDVCQRILGPLSVPIIFGSPVGHTKRPMLTIPLGIRARLRASGEGTLEFLEAAVVES